MRNLNKSNVSTSFEPTDRAFKKVDKILLLLVVVVVVVVVVFSPWASLGRNQSLVRRPVWLWYAASWASF
jgi:quinol-cytochrome oxidoreductase complex cytochrome b subunit